MAVKSVAPADHSLRRIVSVIKFAVGILWSANRGLFITVVLLNSVSSLIIIPNLLLDKQFIDTLISGLTDPDKAAIFRQILLIVGARLGLSLFRTLSRRLSGFYARQFFWRTYQYLEKIIGLKYATIPVPLLENPDFKDRFNRLERESLNRMQRVGENVIRIPQHITGIISSLSFFFTSQPLIVLLSVISLLPGIVVDRIFIRRDYQLDTKITVLHRKRGMYYYYLGRTRSYLESRLLGIHEHLARIVWNFWDEITRLRLQLFRSWRTWGFLAGIIDDTVSYSFDAVFAYQAIVNRITIGTAQAYIRAISSFKTSVTDLTANIMELYESYFYLSDMQWFLSLDSPDFSPAGEKLAGGSRIRFEFRNVWFKYPSTAVWVLRGVNLVIEPGENIAIIGKNGVGKTTLVKLLCGFYAPDKGKILINGIPLERLNKPDYWSRLAVLFQEADAFGITLREIIAAGKLSELNNPDRISQYARAVGIDDWIQSLPDKYDNPIGRDFEHGVTPSTGQWQRIVIARTLLKDAPVMILDEPTSNVDPQAEEDIFNLIISTGVKKTILFISHRFSTVRRADRIILFADGRISEQGSHEQLMAVNGTYARLFRLQAKSYT